MRLSCALLCDAATVREGLLHILGGGVRSLARPSVPAPMGIALALVIDQHLTELDREHRLSVQILSADGTEIARAELVWQPQRPPETLDTEYAFPVVVPLHGATVPAFGAYSIEVLIDGVHQESVPFAVREAAQAPA